MENLAGGSCGMERFVVASEIHQSGEGAAQRTPHLKIHSETPVNGQSRFISLPGGPILTPEKEDMSDGAQAERSG